jgi:CDGSH iron-sulfur domain-containing protein 3
VNADADQPRTPPGVMTIRCREDGPLVVEMPDTVGDGPLHLRVTDHLGQTFPLPDHKRAVALCRCGRSGAKPFCDGSHKRHSFKAAETAPPS